MAIDFPNSPSVNDQFTANGTTWVWTGTVWNTVGTSTVTGPTGASGIVSQTTAPVDISVLWLDTAATAVGVDLDVWTAYTPTWTASTTNPVLNNGTITGRYKQIGKVVHFSIKLAIGSTTTTGTGDWRFTLPITAQNTVYQFPAAVLDNGVSWYQAMGVGDYAGSTSFFSLIVNTANAPSTAISSANPMTWGSADTLTVSGTYEAA